MSPPGDWIVLNDRRLEQMVPLSYLSRELWFITTVTLQSSLCGYLLVCGVRWRKKVAFK